MTNPNPPTPEELAAIRERAIADQLSSMEFISVVERLRELRADRAALLRHIDALEAERAAHVASAKETT